MILRPFRAIPAVAEVIPIGVRLTGVSAAMGVKGLIRIRHPGLVSLVGHEAVADVTEIVLSDSHQKPLSTRGWSSL